VPGVSRLAPEGLAGFDLSAASQLVEKKGLLPEPSGDGRSRVTQASFKKK